MAPVRRPRGDRADVAYGLIEIGSWAEYQRLVERRFRGWAFRGHLDARWHLSSTLARILHTFGVHSGAWARQERRINRIFRRKAHLYLAHVPDAADDFQWLALMQHHGAPTRLLDFTWSPYVAAFFALERATLPAAVWALCVPRLWSARVRPAPGAEPVEVSALRLNVPGNYDRWFVEGTAPFVVQGEPLVMNQRLIAQSGTFVVPGVLTDPIDDIIASYAEPRRTLVKIVLDTARVRDEAMRSLYSMNITQATLFPGLDGMARALAYELEHHWEYDPKTMTVYPDFVASEDPHSDESERAPSRRASAAAGGADPPKRARRTRPAPQRGRTRR